jgi:hypothetical protein
MVNGQFRRYTVTHDAHADDAAQAVRAAPAARSVFTRTRLPVWPVENLSDVKMCRAHPSTTFAPTHFPIKPAVSILMSLL